MCGEERKEGGTRENECKTEPLAPQKGERGSAAHLQTCSSPVGKVNPATLLSSVGKDLSGDSGPVCLRACMTYMYMQAVLTGGRVEKPEKEASRVF